MNLITCGSAFLSEYELQVGSRGSLEFNFTDPTGVATTYFIDLDEINRMINKTIKSFPRVYIKDGFKFYASITKIMGGQVVYMFDTDKEPMCYFMYDEMVAVVDKTAKSFPVYKIVI